MTNTEELRGLIESKGFKYGFIAEYLGITYQSLLNKMENVREFKANEVHRLCKLLDIDTFEEQERIFFTMPVDLKST